MVLYILCVAVLNLAIGFLLALYMAWRYRQIVAAAESAAPDPPSGTSAANRSTSPAPESAPDPNPPSTEEPAPAQAEAGPERDSGAGHADPAESSSAAAHALREILLDPSSTDQQTPSDATPEARGEISPSEASVQDFKCEVEHYHEELTRLDQALRDCPDSPDMTTVKSWANSLREANLEYLGSRRQVEETFRSMDAGRKEPGVLAGDLEAAIQRQDAQIEHSNSMVESCDYQGDLTESSQQMLVETSKLLRVNHEVRDALDATSVVLARSEQRLASVDLTKRTDRLTGLSDRVGLEAGLAAWWEKDPHRVRQLHAAMIDLDHFARLNERYGQVVCDRLLRAIAEMLKAKSRSHTLAARFSGQRFLLLFPDVNLRFATNMIERIRQTIETSRFQYRSDDIQVTVSCAVVTAMSEDTPETMYARAEATLQEAKRYGRNRTFVHDGDFPAPVVPPNFTLEEKFIRI